MNGTPIRSSFPAWPVQAERLLESVARLTDEQLAMRPSPDRWPVWATIGHLACQRVFWLCDFAGEPGASATPYPDAAFSCPGDDDLEHAPTAQQLVEGLEAVFGHDIAHIAELNEVLTAAGLPIVDLWG